MNEQVNILVVDDDETVLEMFRDYFCATDNTYSLVTASHGAEAV
jgi:CheY-like chemotaxis protein